MRCLFQRFVTSIVVICDKYCSWFSYPLSLPSPPPSPTPISHPTCFSNTKADIGIWQLIIIILCNLWNKWNKFILFIGTSRDWPFPESEFRSKGNSCGVRSSRQRSSCLVEWNQTEGDKLYSLHRKGALDGFLACVLMSSIIPLLHMKRTFRCQSPGWGIRECKG